MRFPSLPFIVSFTAFHIFITPVLQFLRLMSVPVTVPNPHIAELAVDNYYHLGFNSSQDLKSMFGDVKFVLFGGSNERMETIAHEFAKTFFPLPLGSTLTPIGSTTRYHMYKVGPILTASHQMGMASFSILVHEMTKLLAASGATDVVYLRIGTSGGLGLSPGTVVITNQSMNGLLTPTFELISLGKRHEYPSTLHPDVIEGLKKAAEQNNVSNVVIGNTMSVDCFYEGQGRLDGALCEYNSEDKFEFIKRAEAVGVKNIEMESLMFGAFCARAGIKAGVICITLVDRTKGDQVSYTHDQYTAWLDSSLNIVKRYVANTLGLTYKA